MSDSNSTPATPADKSAKPSKPYEDFPLFAHAAGVWAKKIRGKLHYFGPWSDPDAALDNYNRQKEALHAGRKPREETDGITVKEMVNEFLDAKDERVQGGEISPRTWDDYKEVCDLMIDVFGKRRLVADLDPEDFGKLRAKMAERWGPVRLGNGVQRVRTVFNFFAEQYPREPRPTFGAKFKRPSEKTLRLHRNRQGPKLFTADEVRRLIAGADAQTKAMILLGANVGFGVSDCGRLPLTTLDLDGGWVTFPRPKTGIERRAALWPETVAAIREALAARPTAKPEHAGLVFVTYQGLPWAKEDASSPLCFKFRQLMKRQGVNGRKGLGIYTLRHVFRTIADEAKDPPAVDHIMGHARNDMASHYREGISDARLRAVADHVRGWLFPAAGLESPAAETVE